MNDSSTISMAAWNASSVPQASYSVMNFLENEPKYFGQNESTGPRWKTSWISDFYTCRLRDPEGRIGAVPRRSPRRDDPSEDSIEYSNKLSKGELR